LLISFCIAVIPAEAATNLKITSTNLYALQSEGIWKVPLGSSGELLVSQSAKDLYIPYQKSWWVNEIGTYGWQAADYANKSTSYGQCTSFVKTLSKSTLGTGSWKQGLNVMTNTISPGTVIATFNSTGVYINKPGESHTAIFRGYVLDSSGKKIGIKVWDQNWVGVSLGYTRDKGLIGRHSITTGIGTHSAKNYYVVQV
jgi:hypothetical protein